MNKNLLLRGQLESSYTHLLTVGVNNRASSYGFNSSFGSISPRYIENSPYEAGYHNINSLYWTTYFSYDFTDNTLVLNATNISEFRDATIHFGIESDGVYYPLFVSGAGNLIKENIQNPFEKYVGQTIKIWLATTPPGSRIKQLFNLLEGCLSAKQRPFTQFKQQTNNAINPPLCQNAWKHKTHCFIAKWKELGSYRIRRNSRGSDLHKNHDRNDLHQFLQSLVLKRIKQCRDFISRSSIVFVSTSHRYKSSGNNDLRQLSFCASHTMGGAYA